LQRLDIKPRFKEVNGWKFQTNRTTIDDGFKEGDLSSLFDEKNVFEWMTDESAYDLSILPFKLNKSIPNELDYKE